MFYPAEQEHQSFYTNHPGYGYCTYVIDPKIEKLKQLYLNKLKKASN